MFRTAFTMDVGILPKLFGIEAGKREQSKLLQSPPGDLVSAAGLMATAGVSSGTRIPVVSIVGCTAAAGDSVGAGGAATESWVDGVSATTGVAIAGGSIAGRTTSAGCPDPGTPHTLLHRHRSPERRPALGTPGSSHRP